MAECLAEGRVKANDFARVDSVKPDLAASPVSGSQHRWQKGIAMGVGCPVAAVSTLLLSIASAPEAMNGGFSSRCCRHARGMVCASAEVEGGFTAARGDAFIHRPGRACEYCAATATRRDLLGPRQEMVNAFLMHAAWPGCSISRFVGPVPVDRHGSRTGQLAEAQVRWEAGAWPSARAGTGARQVSATIRPARCKADISLVGGDRVRCLRGSVVGEVV